MSPAAGLLGKQYILRQEYVLVISLGFGMKSAPPGPLAAPRSNFAKIVWRRAAHKYKPIGVLRVNIQLKKIIAVSQPVYKLIKYSLMKLCRIEYAHTSGGFATLQLHIGMSHVSVPYSHYK